MFMNKLQIFANETVTTDVAPAISIDYANKLGTGIKALQQILGVMDVRQYQEGYEIPIYKCNAKNSPAQAAEGADIVLTEIERVKAKTITVGLKKYRKQVTAEAILKAGRENAINQTDAKLVKIAQNDIKKSIIDGLEDGTGTATAGNTIQKAIANIWASAQTYYEDDDVEMVYFINPQDVAAYLGEHQITLESEFGFNYVSNFLGMGTAILLSGVTKGKPIGTAKANLNMAVVNGGGSTLATTFGLTMDESGLVGINHTPVGRNATLETLLMSTATFFAEDLAGVIVGTYSPS